MKELQYTQHYKHHNRERLCYCCNELQETKEELNRYHISNRGYMSDFDSMSFTIQLCDKCSQDLEVADEWFDNEVSFDSTSGQWYDEAYIINMIETFPIHNQEYIYNGTNLLMPIPMDREDWISANQN